MVGFRFTPPISREQKRATEMDAEEDADDALRWFA